MISVSVVIPAHNSELFIGAAVRSALAQDLRPLEVIVVDDGSSDGTVEEISELPVRLVPLRHGGQAAARNEGVRVSRGEAIAFLDSDDLWDPGKLRWQSALLEANPDVGIAFGQAAQFRGSVETCGPPKEAELPGTSLIRRSTWEAVGGLDPSLRVGEFVDWRIRASEAGVCSVYCPRVALYRRLHAGNLGRSTAGREDYVKVLKAALDRRRGR